MSYVVTGTRPRPNRTSGTTRKRHQAKVTERGQSAHKRTATRLGKQIAPRSHGPLSRRRCQRRKPLKTQKKPPKRSETKERRSRRGSPRSRPTARNLPTTRRRRATPRNPTTRERYTGEVSKNADKTHPPTALDYQGIRPSREESKGRDSGKGEGEGNRSGRKVSDALDRTNNHHVTHVSANTANEHTQ